MVKNNNSLSKVNFEVKELNYNQLRANKGDEVAESGETMYKSLTGFPGMNFVINGKEINSNDITNLPQINNLNSHEKDYRPHLVEAFSKIFEHAGAKAPSKPIIQELITSCHNGYLRFLKSGSSINSNISRRTSRGDKVYIECNDPNCVKINVDSKATIFISLQGTEEMYESKQPLQLSSSLKFQLKSQENEKEVEYTDGKLSLTLAPLSLEVEKDKGLFSKVIKAIQELLVNIFGKEHVKMKEYKFEFNKPRSMVSDPEASVVNKQGESVGKR